MLQKPAGDSQQGQPCEDRETGGHPEGRQAGVQGAVRLRCQKASRELPWGFTGPREECGLHLMCIL